ncbi:hypothetical protein BJ912DRAFT_1091548 [Pholiota molesta]|nr:hypothetical protein BJ912DRAFT_1091548 [Pholiota molesta]
MVHAQATWRASIDIPQPVPTSAGRAGARPLAGRPRTPNAAQCGSIKAEIEIEINETTSLISISPPFFTAACPSPSIRDVGRLDGSRRMDDDDRGRQDTQEMGAGEQREDPGAGDPTGAPQIRPIHPHLKLPRCRIQLAMASACAIPTPHLPWPPTATALPIHNPSPDTSMTTTRRTHNDSGQHNNGGWHGGCRQRLDNDDVSCGQRRRGRRMVAGRLVSRLHTQ